MSTRVFILMALTATASGCLGSALTGDDGGTGGGGGGNVGGDAGGSASGSYVDRFYTDVAPILAPACGGCHGATGTSAPAFMVAQPDMLQNLLAYPGIISDTPEKSRLYAKGLHEGPAFTPDQAPIIRGWIELYNANKPAPPDGGTGTGTGKPTVQPFAPTMGGANTIDLAVLDAAITGVKITFDAQMVGTSIQLSNLKVVTPANIGVHIVHPVFSIWNQNLEPTPDPVDSFSNLDLTVYAGSTVTLGPGTLLMPNFAAGELLNVVFTLIEPKMGSNDAGTVTGCKALTMFVQNVKPLFAANACSTQCHVGANPTAGLKLDTAPDAALCAVALTEINKTTPAQSQLLLQPDPAQNNGHPRKVNPFTAYQTAVTNWINAEK
jgi:hypothetical protein